MNGTVKKLYDISGIEIPKDVFEINVQDSWGKEAIEQLTIRFADEIPTEIVEKGNIVYCDADKESYPDGRKILIFTGLSLPGAEKAETDLIGKKVNDEVKTVICEKEVLLKITRIVHIVPSKIDDSLVKKANIQDVNTLEDYEKYVINERINALKSEKMKTINGIVIDELVNNSEIIYDESEMKNYVDSSYSEFLKMYPDEDLGDENEFKASIEYRTKQVWIAEAFCNSVGMKADRTAAESDAEQMIQMYELMGETAPEKEKLVKEALSNQYFIFMFEYIENMFKDRIGGNICD